ncbi:MAG: tRNA pseudouridine(55) synthase TruB [Proteobacteria bacterium]|jgi:tRNA pseudouridine55 synthase|nr:tRNA pseudouridine(55) synthase TruB [Pseudomonadota bacterium]
MVGKRKSGRDINGILLLDKPTGVGSNRVLQASKRLFSANKAGHTGSLDPLATGLLPICLGNATRFAEYFLHTDKHYLATLKLGVTTDTLDSDGTVTSTRDVDVSQRNVDAELAAFRGKINQTPPMFSALKQDGKPLYKLARAGKQVERAARQMEVYELSAELIEPDVLQVEVKSSGGFYVRQLASDLGEALGCGAHITALRRMGVRELKVQDAVTLDTLNAMTPEERDELLYNSDLAVNPLPELVVTNEQAVGLLHGRKLKTDLPVVAGLVRAYTDSRIFLGVIYWSEEGLLKPRKMFAEHADLGFS